MILAKSRRFLRNFLRGRYGLDRESSKQNQYIEQFAYGHREVLLNYSKLPLNLIFKAILPHGKITPHALDPIIPAYDLEDGTEILQLLWRDDSLNEANIGGAKNVIPIGAPFLYALANLGQSIEVIEDNLKKVSKNHICSMSGRIELLDSQEKITYMPLHRWEGDVHKHDIPDNFPLRKIDPSKITVCLGFLDFCDPEIRKLYSSFGWALTCAGIRESKILGSPAGGSQKFLYELANIFDGSDLVIGNEFTTGLFYAAACGKRIGILPSNNSHEMLYSSWNSESSFNDDLMKQKCTFGWLWDENMTPDEIFEDLSCSLGIKSFKTPDFFWNQVEKLEFIG